MSQVGWHQQPRCSFCGGILSAGDKFSIPGKKQSVCGTCKEVLVTRGHRVVPEHTQKELVVTAGTIVSRLKPLSEVQRKAS